jgi:hypothetical protein
VRPGPVVASSVERGALMAAAMEGGRAEAISGRSPAELWAGRWGGGAATGGLGTGTLGRLSGGGVMSCPCAGAAGRAATAGRLGCEVGSGPTIEGSSRLKAGTCTATVGSTPLSRPMNDGSSRVPRPPGASCATVRSIGDGCITVELLRSVKGSSSSIPRPDGFAETGDGARPGRGGGRVDPRRALLGMGGGTIAPGGTFWVEWVPVSSPTPVSVVRLCGALCSDTPVPGTPAATAPARVLDDAGRPAVCVPVMGRVLGDLRVPPVSASARIDAPSATTSSGGRLVSGSRPKKDDTRWRTVGMRVLPPTRITAVRSVGRSPASLSASEQTSKVREMKGAERRSSSVRESDWENFTGCPPGRVMSMLSRLESRLERSHFAVSAASRRMS